MALLVCIQVVICSSFAVLITWQVGRPGLYNLLHGQQGSEELTQMCLHAATTVTTRSHCIPYIIYTSIKIATLQLCSVQFTTTNKVQEWRANTAMYNTPSTDIYDHHTLTTLVIPVTHTTTNNDRDSEVIWWWNATNETNVDRQSTV